MSLVSEQHQFSLHIARLIQKADSLGLSVTFGEAYLRPALQQWWLDNGGIHTRNNQHLKRLAVDLNFYRQDTQGGWQAVQDSTQLKALGDFWKSLADENQWGGHLRQQKRVNHFERRENLGAVSHAKGIGLLKGSVGARCDNQAADVELVQRLINFQQQRIALHEPLVCDGKFGTNTGQAIAQFFKKVLPELGESAVILPDSEALLSLASGLPNQWQEENLSLLYLAAPKGAVKKFSQAITDCMAHYGIDEPLRQMHFLAQIGHESGELVYQEEIASGEAYEKREDLGNLKKGDGVRFKGRGLIQLTGRTNYTAYAAENRFGIDMLATPELVASNPELCVDVAGWFWQKRRLNLYADNDDVREVTRRINGGFNGLKHRVQLLSRAKALMGWPVASGGTE